MIDRDIKRCLGQMMKGVQVVSASVGGQTRAYCSHWVCQISFEEPIVLASVSTKHDTYPLMREAGRFTVSILAADQVAEGQYFSYPGRRFHRMATEYLTEVDGDRWVVPRCISWLGCETIEVQESVGGAGLDHHLFFARVTSVGDFGRLKDPPLLYSTRLGWRQTGESAREPGGSVRDELLARLAASGLDRGGDDDGP
jgi:flavin reductase (DIM6/NTAB) family NADH-FMN oxidoreductase RutF